MLRHLALLPIVGALLAAVALVGASCGRSVAPSSVSSSSSTAVGGEGTIADPIGGVGTPLPPIHPSEAKPLILVFWASH